MSEYLDKLIAEMEASGTAPRIAAKQKRKGNNSQAVLTVREAAEGSPYSYEKNGKKYLAEYIGLVGAPEAQPADPNFPTGQMSYDTFPYGAMSEAPEPTKYPVLPEKYVSPVDERTYYWSGKIPEMPKVRSERLPTTGLVETSDVDYLFPQRPNIDWDEEAKKDAEEAASTPVDVGVSYAGGLSNVAVDPGQVRSAVSGFVPNEEPKNVAVDPMQFLSNNGLLPANGAVNLDEIMPEAEDAKIPRWAKVAMGLADAMRISGTRGGLFPETAVEDPNAKMGATFDEILKQQKQEAEYEKQAKQNDLARAKILSQRAMEETDPARKAIYGEAIKRLLPRETQGLDPVTASGMFTGDDKIALEKEKQKGRELLQMMKGQQGYGLQELKGTQASALEDKKQANKIEQIREQLNNQTNLAAFKSSLRFQENEQKHGYNMALQQLRNDGAMARRSLTAGKTGKTRGEAGAPTAEEMNRIGIRTATDVLAELKELNNAAGRWRNYTDPNDFSWVGAHLLYPDADYAAAVAAGTVEAQAFQEYSNKLKQLVQDQLRKIYGAQFTEKEGERFFESMGVNPLVAPEKRWALATSAINDLRLKHGFDEINPDTLEIIPNTAFRAPVENMKVGESRVIGDGIIITKNSD